MDAYFEWKLMVEQATMMVMLGLFLLIVVIWLMTSLYMRAKILIHMLFPYAVLASDSPTKYQVPPYHHFGPKYPWMMKLEKGNRHYIPICAYADAPWWQKLVAKKIR